MSEKHFPAKLLQSRVQGQKLLSASTLEKKFRFKANLRSIIPTSGMNKFSKELEVIAKISDDIGIIKQVPHEGPTIIKRHRTNLISMAIWSRNLCTGDLGGIGYSGYSTIIKTSTNKII
jgi:hypothetical protein